MGFSDRKHFTKDIIALLQAQQKSHVERSDDLQRRSHDWPLRTEDDTPEGDPRKWPAEMRQLHMPLELAVLVGSETVDIVALNDLFESARTANPDAPTVRGVSLDEIQSQIDSLIEQQYGDAFEKLKKAQIAHAELEHGQKIHAMAQSLIGDIGHLEQLGYDRVYLDSVQYGGVAGLGAVADGNFTYFKPEVQNKQRIEEFQRAASRLVEPKIGYKNSLHETVDPHFLGQVKAALSKSGLGRGALAWLDSHGREIKVMDETERSTQFKCNTVAWVTSEKQDIYLVRRTDITMQANAEYAAHEWWHLGQGMRAPELEAPIVMQDENDERMAVDAFIRMRVIEAAAYSFDDMVVQEMDDLSFKGTPDKFLQNFLVNLSLRGLFSNYDLDYMNMAFLKVIDEGRLPEMVAASNLCSTDVIGRLLRFDENAPNFFADTSIWTSEALNSLHDRFVGGISQVDPPAELMEAYRETLPVAERRAPLDLMAVFLSELGQRTPGV